MSKELAAQPSDPNDPNREPDKYEIESAAEHLTKAEEIKQNKKLMPHVIKHLAKKKKAINSIEQLRQVAKDKMAENDNDEDDQP